MKNAIRLTLALIVAATLNSLAAQEATQDHNDQPASKAPESMSDSQTTQTIRGEVLSVDKAKSKSGMDQGIHLRVRTERGTIPVHLGPSWFMEKQDFTIKPHDQVEVTGSQVTLNGKTALIAQEVKKGDEVLKLRDENGRPAWAGGPGAPGGMGQGMGTGQGMGMSGRGTTAEGLMEQQHQQMMQRHQQMMAQHQKMLSEQKAMDAQLDQKLTRMNKAQGDEKVDAMADVINQLVKDRRTMRQNMAQMHQQMMSQMGGMPGRTESGLGAPGNSDDSEKGDSDNGGHDDDQQEGEE